MSTGTLRSWSEMNQRYVGALLAGLRERMAGNLVDPYAGSLQSLVEDMPAPPAIETLREAFGLSDFERDVLLLCAGIELDAAFASVLAAKEGAASGGLPTFSLAMAALDGAHWSALSPASPLRRWKLVEVLDGPALTRSSIRIDERVLHYLVGVNYPEPRLGGIIRAVEADGTLLPSQVRHARIIAHAWTSGDDVVPACIQLLGPDAASSIAVAAGAAQHLGLEIVVMRAEDVPLHAIEREDLIRLWERDAALGMQALVIDCMDTDAAPPGSRAAVDLAGRVASPVMVMARQRLDITGRVSLHLAIDRPDRVELREIWEHELGHRGVHLNGQLDRIVDQFRLGPRDIEAVGAGLAAGGETPVGDDLFARLWALCRAQASPSMDGLAQRIDAVAGWADLVLPVAQKQVLEDIAIHVRQRARVYGEWGFAGKGRRGLGISALFAGPSGTGKTMAAEVLANELSLDLYRIDLSQVVSKYIGETEKNLGKLFDAAEEGGAILLFDEADALFGKRSDVRDSHDRYANIEVSYLLQRMEAFDGLAILTTNLKASIDHAFMRRIRFSVQFPFPDMDARAAIWQRIFPDRTPLEALDTAKLARLNVAGGNIRNIALNAAFLAAEDQQPVSMRHVLRAARSEASKLERPISESEIRDWV